MKAILFSIQKEHNDNIFSGKKRFEGRKVLPKIIKLANYQPALSTAYVPSKNDVKGYIYEPKTGGGCGKIVGEFICDFAHSFNSTRAYYPLIAESLCVSEEFARKYFNRDIGYMLRICNPVKYDKPKELSEFTNTTALSYGEWFDSVYNRDGLAERKYQIYLNEFRLKRPPQSWCYVKELK